MWFVQSTYLAAVGSTAIDTLFYASAFNLSGHLKIIQYNLEHLEFNGIINDSEGLCCIISKYTQIIDTCNDLTDVYKPILLTQFLISSLQICVIAYQLTLVGTGA